MKLMRLGCYLFQTGDEEDFHQGDSGRTEEKIELQDMKVIKATGKATCLNQRKLKLQGPV